MPMLKTADDLMHFFSMGLKVRIEHVKAGKVMLVSDMQPDKDSGGRRTKKRLLVCEDEKTNLRTNNDMLLFNVTAFIITRADGSEERFPTARGGSVILGSRLGTSQA